MARMENPAAANGGASGSVHASELNGPENKATTGTAQAPLLWRDVPVADILVVPDRMRRLRPDTVDELAESISARPGQLQPIGVRPRGDGRLVLVFGRHRLEAVRKLGRETIRAAVLEGIGADAAQLVEIDENLIRADLSPIERDLHIARRKEIYEREHPNAVSVRKRGGPGRGKKNESHGATGFID